MNHHQDLEVVLAQVMVTKTDIPETATAMTEKMIHGEETVTGIMKS